MSTRGGDFRWWLGALVVLAFVLRVVGLTHGLPWVVGPDEGFEVHRALRLGAGEFDFERTGKGGLFYLLFVEYAVYFVGLWAMGAVESARDFALRFAADPTPFWVIGRFTSVVLGTLLVPATWWLGRRLYGPVAALFGAAVVAVTPVHVKSAHTINVDLPMALLVVVTLLLAANHARIGAASRSRPVALGLALGGAMLCKLPAVVAVVPVWLSNVLRRSDRQGLSRWFGGSLGTTLLVAATLFVIGNPGVVAAFETTARGVLGVLLGGGTQGPEAGAAGGATVNLWWFYAGAVQRAVGTPLAILLVAGLLRAFHGAFVGGRAADRLLLSFLVPTFLLFALARTDEHYYDRYVIPWIPLLALVAGALVADVWGRWRSRPGVVRVGVAVLLAAVVMPPLLDSMAVASEFRRPDTREAALEWLEANAPPHSRVFVVGNPLVRSALTVPMRRRASDLERWAAEHEDGARSKSQVLEARAALEEGVPYDVLGVRHDAPNLGLQEYLDAGVRYFVLDRESFDPARVRGDPKVREEVRASRTALYEALREGEGVRLAWASTSEGGPEKSGPALEIHQVEQAAPPPPVRGTVETGRLIEVGLGGPALSPRGDPNPFAIEVTVVLTTPGGETATLPAFYGRATVERDGGDVVTGSGPWRFRLRPWESGEWSFLTSSSEPSLDRLGGRLVVAPASGPVRGRLLASDRPYLRFEDGTWWLKGGCDDPEDFLAPGVMGDWKAKRKGLEYLASRGVNSIYLMPHTVDGDGDNVWPWIARKRSDRFDVEKLARWEELFSHAQDLGLVLHLVLEDDSGWTGFDRRLYYRELVARFAHHPALIWNVSEEFDENYSPTEIRAFAKMIDELDPYDHPITVHHTSGTTLWKPFLEDPRFTVTSFQTDKAPQNRRAREWRQRAREAGRALVVSFDETGAAEPEDRDLLRHIAWSVYLGGANYELHVREMKDFRDFEATWDDLRRARSFVESMPFWEMEPCNDMLVEGRGYCYGTAEEDSPGPWSIYLPDGGSAVLELPTARVEAGGAPSVRWYDPRTGDWRDGAGQLDGAELRIDSPLSGDAAVRIEFAVDR